MVVQKGFRRLWALLLVMLLLFSSTAGLPLAAESASQRVVVQASSLAAAKAAVGVSQGRVTAEISIINAVIADVPVDKLDYLAQLPTVVRVTKNLSVESASNGIAEVIDVDFSAAMGVPEVWDAGNTGEGITVAFLDTGIDPRFTELCQSGRCLAYYDVFEDTLYEGSKLNKSPQDPNGHGTHIASIVGNDTYEKGEGEYHGVAPGVNMVAVQVLNEQGMGTYADVLKGLEWVVTHKDEYDIRVLNISMYAEPLAPYWADPYNLAVMAAWDAGIVVVASAGNTGPDPMSVGVPGNTPYVITVGAYTDHRTPDVLGDDYIPEFSAAGPTLDAFVKPDVIAPGAHMLALMKQQSTLSEEHPDFRVDKYYFEMSGTSMSTASVSGVVALMLSENPDLTPDEVKYRLMSTARPQYSESAAATAYSIWQQGSGRVWAPDAVYADISGAANQGMDIAADLAGLQHYQGWTTFDRETGTFQIIGGGFDSWADGYTVWNGGFDSWADGYTNWSGGDDNWTDSFDSWADGFDSWADGFDSWADGFDSWADGFDSWADSFHSIALTCQTKPEGFDSWADGFDSWADGFDSWADGTQGWADGFDSWADGYAVWMADFDSWADSFDSWADANSGAWGTECEFFPNGFDSWADGFDSWADGFDSWADGFDSWADGFDSWADGVSNLSGAYSVWSGGYTVWSDGYDSWADGFESWADGYDSWADACGLSSEDYDSWADGFESWADGFESWADGYDSWADGFESWADYVVWLDGFESWADGFESWADGYDSWADSYDSSGRPLLCTVWPDGFESWADGFESWADGFESWADGLPLLSSSFEVWDGGYTVWADGVENWGTTFDSWASSTGNPTWASDFMNLQLAPTNTTVSIDFWVDPATIE